MSKQNVTPALGSMALVLSVPCGVAQTVSTPPAGQSAAPPPGAVEQWIKDVKAPASWLTWGADLRVRNEYYDNSASLTDTTVPAGNHEQDVVRYRGRVWASAYPVDHLSLNVRVSAEPREWMRPSFVGAYRDQTGMEWRYGIVDNLNVKYTNILNQPLSVTAGRQDIMFGDFWNWWLVADGTPGDGSWTFFLDSIRATYDAAEIKTKFDLVYINQNAMPDAMLPTIGSARNNGVLYNLVEQNEQGVIAYASNKSLKNTTVDGYFIYKRDDRIPLIASGDNADIYTAGGRVTGLVADHLQYAVEGAYQFGEKEDRILAVNAQRDIQAYGGNARVDYLFKDQLKNQAHFVYEYLSGDDPNTGRDEMFDILWGRWPRWSELYIYSYIFETGGKIAQLNNIQRVGGGWSINPSKKTEIAAYYNALFAPEENPTRCLNAALFSRNGDFRGHYVQAVLKHKFTPHISAHLWSEFVFEGDYYAQRDMLSFLRAEVMLTF